MMTNSATYLSDVGLMRIDMVMTLLGNFSERPVTPYALGIDSSLVIIYLHGFAMAGCTVNSFSLMDVCKTSSHPRPRLPSAAEERPGAQAAPGELCMTLSGWLSTPTNTNKIADFCLERQLPICLPP